MATSLTPVTLPPGIWVDLYAATGIVLGTQLTTQNTGSSPAQLSESLAEPISTTGRNNINVDDFLKSAVTPVGVWAISRLGTILQVEES